MITIKDLLDKIKWDKRENREDYELRYFDRVSRRLMKLKLSDVIVEDNLIKTIRHGKEINIPLHRVRKILRNGELIFKR